jgi:protein tyrosine/serine phosphatase
MMQDRVFSFEGVRNFRDFGAYQGADGRYVQSGRLFRSAQFGEATDRDIQSLGQLNIVVQADLRRPDERDRHGHKWPVTGVNVLTSDKGRAKDAPHVRFLTEVSVDAAKARDWMTDYYRAAPFKPQHVDLFRDWFGALEALKPGEAAVVNCAAGKDRTGILCALTHHVLGVHPDAIMADYELTNQAANVAERLAEMARLFNQHIGKTYPDDVYHPFVGVHADFLTAAIGSMEAESGSLEAYLANTLGLTPDRQEILRDKLLD